MVRMGVIKADDLESAFSTVALNPDHLAGIDFVSRRRRIMARIPTFDGHLDTHAIAFADAQQNSAALVRICPLAVESKLFESAWIEVEHGNHDHTNRGKDTSQVVGTASTVIWFFVYVLRIGN